MSFRTAMSGFTCHGDGDIDWGASSAESFPQSSSAAVTKASGATGVRTASPTKSSAFTRSPSGFSYFNQDQPALPMNSDYSAGLTKYHARIRTSRFPLPWSSLPAEHKAVSPALVGSSTENKIAHATPVSTSPKPSKQYADTCYFFGGFTGFESLPFLRGKTPSEQKRLAAIQEFASFPSFYLSEWIVPEPTAIGVAELKKIDSENKAAGPFPSSTITPRTFIQPDAAQVLARTLCVAPVSAAFIPAERTMRKLVGEQAKGNETTFMHCFTKIRKDHPMKGYFSKMNSNIFKSGVLFGIQSIVGGYPGFLLGGMFQGIGTSAQQVLDHKLAKNNNARNYWDVLRQSEFRPLMRNFNMPCKIGALQGGVFWYSFTSQSAYVEQLTKDWLNRNGLENTPISEVAPFVIRFGVAGGVGFITYPSYQLIQVFIRCPELCITDAILGNAKPQTVKEALPLIPSIVRNLYRGGASGLGVFSASRAAVLSAALAADKFVNCIRDSISSDCISKKPR